MEPSTALPSIIIGHSKGKLMLLLLMSLAFVAAGWWMWQSADTELRYEPLVLKIVGLVGMIFFGAAALVGVFQLLSPRPGLLLDAEGIRLPASVGAPTLIRWQQVQGFEVVQIHRTKLLLVLINNPAELLAQQRGWRRYLMRLNLQQYGTPYSISSNTLQIGFDELLRTVTERFHAVKGASPEVSR